MRIVVCTRGTNNGGPQGKTTARTPTTTDRKANRPMTTYDFAMRLLSRNVDARTIVRFLQVEGVK